MYCLLYILKNIIILAHRIFPVSYIGASTFTSDTRRAPSHRNKERDGSNKSNPDNKKIPNRTTQNIFKYIFALAGTVFQISELPTMDAFIPSINAFYISREEVFALKKVCWLFLHIAVYSQQKTFQKHEYIYY